MTDYIWTGKGHTNNFDDAANWKPEGFPQYADVVTLTHHANVISNGDYTFNNLIIEHDSTLTEAGGSINVNGTTLIHAGSTFIVAEGAAFNSQSNLSIFGTFIGSGKLTGNGTISGEGGTLKLINGENIDPFNPLFGTVLKYELAGNAQMNFNNAPGPLSEIVFSGNDNILALPDYTGIFFGKITGFAEGDAIQFPDRLITSVTEVRNYDGSYSVALHAAGYDPVLLTDVVLTPSEHLSIVNVGGHSELVVDGVEPVGVVFCFAPGVKLLGSYDIPRRTMREIRVEDLRVGDLLLCDTNGSQEAGRLDRVRWIGYQKIDSRNGDPFKHGPILLKAGSFGSNPTEDIMLSPEHAVLVGDVLIQAGAMVNGDTIIRQEIPEGLIYYHIEMECGHTCVFASGLPCETFVDNVDRRGFDNWDKRTTPEDAIAEMSHPRAKSVRQIPPHIQQTLGRTTRTQPVDFSPFVHIYGEKSAIMDIRPDVDLTDPGIEQAWATSTALASAMKGTLITREIIVNDPNFTPLDLFDPEAGQSFSGEPTGAAILDITLHKLQDNNNSN